MRWHNDAWTYFLLDRLSLDQETAQTDRQTERGREEEKSISLTMRINAVADGSRGGGIISGGESKTIYSCRTRARCATSRYAMPRYVALRLDQASGERAGA